jgi:glycine/D-amino acid oxidase-like deaminating enzyme
LVNPVTGRRFVKSWNIDQLLGHLTVYEQIEKLLDCKLMQELTIYRDLDSPSVRNQWDLRRMDTGYQAFLQPPVRNDFLPVAKPDHLGPTASGFQVDLRALLHRYRIFLLQRKWLSEQQVSIDSAQRVSNGWCLAGFTVRYVIDCSGAAAINTACWGKLPWRGTKGEALRYEFSGFPRSAAVKQRHFICPVNDRSTVWLGGTNSDHYEDASPTVEAAEQLLNQIEQFGLERPAAYEHCAAIRPTVKDRRPLVGQLPELPGLYLCNGLGTKGTSLAPYCTLQLVDHIFSEAALDTEISLENRLSQVQ